MEHVVFFSEDSGEPEFRRVGDLAEAVRLVESLRNERDIADVTVHALTPVPVSFKTYYRVEVPGVEVPGVELPAVPTPADEVAAVESEPEALVVPSLVADAPVAPALTLLPPPSPFDLGATGTEDAVPFSAEPTEAGSHADDETAVSYGTLTSLSYQPVADEASVGEGVDSWDAEATEESSDEPLVPLARPEPETERSLGYFAR